MQIKVHVALLILPFWFLFSEPSFAQPATRNSAPSTAPSLVVALQARIAVDVEQLKKESLRESVEKLSGPRMFYWPAGSLGGYFTEIPARDSAELHSINRIASNRRFLKVFDQLGALPKAEAAQIISSQLLKSLPKYQELFEQNLQRLVESRKQLAGKETASHGFTADLPEDDTPTLHGFRLQILSLMLIAGNLELTDAAPALSQVSAVAFAQRSLLYKKDGEHSELDRATILVDASLYNRTVLATVAIDAMKIPPQAELRQETKVLTKFDAAFTEFDRTARVRVPPDFSKGTVKLSFRSPVADPLLDGLFAAR